jgi:hypothetical protein
MVTSTLIVALLSGVEEYLIEEDETKTKKRTRRVAHVDVRNGKGVAGTERRYRIVFYCVLSYRISGKKVWGVKLLENQLQLSRRKAQGGKAERKVLAEVRPA